MKRARYICVEGTEGVGKTTQVKLLVEHLRKKGYRVLQTKEPGTEHAPITLTLRGIMLDNQYDQQLTVCARELISQAIRSIHVEKVILPALKEYDYIIQDRGILSGLAYGTACGNTTESLKSLKHYILSSVEHDLPLNVYDSIIYLKGDTASGLNRAAKAKQEFSTGDAMESRGNNFMQNVSELMNNFSRDFNTTSIVVDGKNIESVFNEILHSLSIEG